MIRCEICGKGPAENVAVYRANEKGVKGIWRCAKHPSAESFTVQNDPRIRVLDDALDGGHK